MTAARVRTCAGCGTKQEKSRMLRIVRTPEGEILPDPGGKRSGRGVYVCRSKACLEKAQKRKSLERSLRTAVSREIYEQVRGVIDEHESE